MKFFCNHTRYFFVASLFLFYHTANAQPGFYVPGAGKIFFNGDTATIFSNVINQGHLGIGKNAFINFTGKTWENSPLSSITDESNSGNGISGIGGWVRFFSDSTRQQLKGGYNAATKSGPLFSHLQIQNRYGIDLSESSTKVRKEIRFSEGKMFLNNSIIAIGDNNPGKISGYDSLRYFVTGNKPGSGFLMRENIRNTDGRIDFPVGSREGAYTPAAIKNNSIRGDDYYVNVFDSVKSGRFTGNNLFAESVNKTWEIGKRFRPGLNIEEIFLQHLNTEEGSSFTRNKKNAYIAYLNGSIWDTGSPQTFPAPGYLTSGNPLINSGVNSRIFYNKVLAPSYFTKLTGFGDTSSMYTSLWLNAWRLDPSIVNLYWRAKTWNNIQYYVVQRRLNNEPDFKNIDTVLSKDFKSISSGEFFYVFSDSNNYTGISYYRLKRLDAANVIAYSNVVAVDGKPGSYINMLWPNPTPDKFYIGLHQNVEFKSIIVFNVWGQKVKEEAVNGRTLIEMGGLISGTYFVSLVNAADFIVGTRKLVVAGK